MLKWFFVIVALLLSVIAVLAWQLMTVTSNGTTPTLSEGFVSEFVSTQNLTEVSVKDLFHKRGCVNCHDSKNTLLGPSFSSIADRYQSELEARDILLTSLRQGSQGKWGSVHTMPIHTTAALSDSEADAMIAWMLEPANSQ